LGFLVEKSAIPPHLIRRTVLRGCAEMATIETIGDANDPIPCRVGHHERR
jgi:hypothetical protein